MGQRFAEHFDCEYIPGVEHCFVTAKLNNQTGQVDITFDQSARLEDQVSRAERRIKVHESIENKIEEFFD